LIYLNSPGCFLSMDKETYEDKISPFSPFSAVESRTQTLPIDNLGNYFTEELKELNKEFKSIAGTSPLMNDFHVHGPDVYKHYFLLVNSWIESEWHMTRHAAYSSSNCLMSSNWLERSILDFDKNSRIYYQIDTRMDDSLRKTQERFGQLDSSLLLDVISDRRWRPLIQEIRSAQTLDEFTRASDKIFSILSNKITTFSFDNNGGHISITARKINSTIDLVSDVSTCLTAIERSLHDLFGVTTLAESLNAPGVDSALPYLSAVKATKVIGSKFLPALRWVNEQAVGHHLRYTVVPRLYAGNKLN